MLKYPDPIYNYSDIPNSWKSYSPADFDENEILQYNSKTVRTDSVGNIETDRTILVGNIKTVRTVSVRNIETDRIILVGNVKTIRTVSVRNIKTVRTVSVGPPRRRPRPRPQGLSLFSGPLRLNTRPT